MALVDEVTGAYIEGSPQENVDHFIGEAFRNSESFYSDSVGHRKTVHESRVNAAVGAAIATAIMHLANVIGKTDVEE